MMLIESNCDVNNRERTQREGFADVICSWPLMASMLKQRAASEIAAAKNTALGAVHEHVRVLGRSSNPTPLSAGN